MIYEIIFILTAVILCVLIIWKLHENDLKEMWSILLQIIFVTAISLIFLEVKNIVLFILFILGSFLLKGFLKNIFYSKKKIKIIKK